MPLPLDALILVSVRVLLPLLPLLLLLRAGLRGRRLLAAPRLRMPAARLWLWLACRCRCDGAAAAQRAWHVRGQAQRPAAAGGQQMSLQAACRDVQQLSGRRQQWRRRRLSGWASAAALTMACLQRAAALLMRWASQGARWSWLAGSEACKVAPGTAQRCGRMKQAPGRPVRPTRSMHLSQACWACCPAPWRPLCAPNAGSAPSTPGSSHRRIDRGLQSASQPNSLAAHPVRSFLWPLAPAIDQHRHHGQAGRAAVAPR